MEFETLFLEIEHKIGKLEKMAQRFTGVTESVDEFQRRIEKESKQQQSINKALFDLKKKQDNEQDRIRRGLSPAQAEFEKKREKEAKRAQRKLFAQKGGELNRYHDEQMKYLNDAYTDPNSTTYRNTMTYKQQEILNKKRGSIELDEDEIKQSRAHIDSDNDDIKSDNSDVSSLMSQQTLKGTNSNTNSTNEHETRKLESNEYSKKQKTLNKLKQRKDIRSEQIELIEQEHKWFRRHCNFLYNADDLEFIFTKNFKLTVTDFDKINRIQQHPLDRRVEFIKELNRDVLNEKDKPLNTDHGHIRNRNATKTTNMRMSMDTNITALQQQQMQLHRSSVNSIQQHHRRQTSILYDINNIDIQYDEDEQEMGVFHIRFNGVCTFTPYDNKLHRLPIEKQKLKYDIQNNQIKGKRITISRYVDRMTHNEKVTCWIKLDEYLQECLVNVHSMRAINIYENEDGEDEYEENEDEQKQKTIYNTYHAIFMSKRIALRRPQCDRIVVLCPQHKHHIRHGLWSRSASLCGNLAFGTMLNYIYTGTTLNIQSKNSLWSAKHFDYVIAEPNCFVLTSAVDSACPGGTFPVIPSHNNNSKAHFEWLWDKYLVHKDRAKIFWIGHCEGCDDIKYLLSVRPTAAARTAGIVFMDYCINAANKDLSMSSQAAAARPDPSIPNPAFGRFFNGKTDNWFIKPILISTHKYPAANSTNYGWDKEGRGDFSNTNSLSNAPVLLLYSVNTNWRFTPCLSMYIINKYLLSRGIIDDEYLWKSNHERFEYLKNIRNQPSKQDIQDNFYRGLAMQQESQQILLSNESHRNIFNMSYRDHIEDEFKEEKLEKPEEKATFESRNSTLLLYNTIPDHLLPAAHEQGPNDILQMSNNINRAVYSKLPPKLMTVDMIKERKKREKEEQKLREEAIAIAIQLEQEAERKRLEQEAKENEEEEDGEGDGKKKKKKKRKKDKGKKDKKREKKDRKKRKKKGRHDDDDEEDNDKKKKKKKDKKKKRDKKKKSKNK